jgi:sugar/nucleoside kinase (ribokinase family)
MSNDVDVIVYGTVCLDAIWRVQALPQPGEYMPILEERKVIGGEAANTAIALAKWGVRVALVGTALGDDEDGQTLRKLFALDAPEIDLQYISTLPDAHTPYCVCIATPDGHRTMFGRGFDEMQCPVLDREVAQSARLFTMDPNAYNAGLQACAIAAQAGLDIVAMDYTRSPEINRIAKISVTSHEHIGAAQTEAELAEFAADLRDTFGPAAIVTWGQNGCFVAEAGMQGERAVRLPAYVAPSLIDSTGAGDVYRAGLLYGLLHEWDILRIARFASAAAALNCGEMGGWNGVKTVKEIENFQQTADKHPLQQ